MIIGVPTEIKNNENRVALTPAGVFELANNNHSVLVQSGAGLGSGFSDSDYKEAGAVLHSSAESVFQEAQMILKVKEPLESEYPLIRKGQVVFTYFHFAASEKLTKAMIASEAICIAYETIEGRNGDLPLLTPMSMVAGRLAVQEGAKYLMKSSGGSGVLLGGVPGVQPGKVIILGGGVVGTESAKMAAGLGADVSIFDVSAARLRELDHILPANVKSIFSNSYNITKAITDADLVIGAVLIPGGKAPMLVKKDMLAKMKPGSVLVDVAVDQGGCIETVRPTTHENPVYMEEGIVHYGVANMPGAVPVTSTQALTNATLPYVVRVANDGWEQACRDDQGFKRGLNIVNGRIVHEAVKEAWGE